MSFTPNFVASQNFGAISTLSLADTGTGTDTSLTSRRVYLKRFDGAYLVAEGTSTNYTVWPIANDSIDINAIDRDYAVEATIQWMEGTTVKYTETAKLVLYAYGEQCLYNLTKYQTSTPSIVNNANYYQNKLTLRCLLDDAKQAVEQAGDYHAGQLCLTLAKRYVDNQNQFF